MYTGQTYKDDIACIIGCQDCALSLSRMQIAVYRGNPRADLMIIGEAPGDYEDKSGIPFTGTGGKYLVTQLAQHGLTTSTYYATNVCLCRPPDNRIPYDREINACSQWLTLQVKLVAPKVILAVGKIAAHKCIPDLDTKLKSTDIEGREYQPPWLRGAVVIPIIHPSAILRAPHKMQQYEETIKVVATRIKELLSRPADTI